MPWLLHLCLPSGTEGAAAHIFRARPDGRGFEPVMTGGMDNPVGVTFGPAGERFLSGTFFQLPAAGKRDGLIHALLGGVYGKENAASVGHPRTGELMPIMTHMGAAAPCGSVTLRSNTLGAGFEVFGSMKTTLDPNGILNPGKLGLDDPFGTLNWPAS